MKVKFISSFVAVSLVVGGTGVYAYNQHLQAVEKERVEQEQIKLNLETAEEKVKGLYNEDRTKLAVEISSKIEEAINAVSLVEPEADQVRLFNEIEDVKKLANAQKLAYGLLVENFIADSTTLESIESVKKEVLEVKTINHAIFSYLLDYVNEASEQLTILQTAEGAVEQAESSLDNEFHDTAKLLVEKVKHEGKREEFNKRLDVVKLELVAMEEQRKKEQQEREALEAKKAQEAAQTAQTVQPTTERVVSNSNSNAGSSNKSANSNVASNSYSNSSSSTPSSGGSSTNKQENNSKNTSNGGFTGGTDWDSIGKELENKDWNHTGSGEIGEPGEGEGNTWDSWD